MTPRPQRRKGRDGTLSTLNLAIDALDLAENICDIVPARVAFGSVSVFLTTIRDSMTNHQEYVELGLNCADICKALDRGVDGKKLNDLCRGVCEAINQLTTTVAEIQKNVAKKNGRNPASRLLHAKNDKVKIAVWKLELDRILQVFNTELVINTNVTVSDIRNDVSRIREEISGQVRSTQNSVPGELPPSPSTCFGRDELIKNIISCAENLIPVALIGAGGIGKTSITLTVLHDDRIRQRFGDNRRFIRCDQFPVSLAHFLARLSKVIGAGIENPEDLTPLRPSLSSREMILFLDNVESILDPQGTDAREIYDVVEELSRFSNICLGITSRISTVPPRCRRPIIPTLSIESSCNIFYDIYNSGGRSDVISNLVKQLDFHALSVTLLATAAPHNMWDYDRLTKEWNAHRGQVLRTDYNESLAATIELSLASPTFRSLGADTRELLGVVAFFPQGVDENNLDWLFPTISNRKLIFDKFCVLSLAHRSNGRFTMLAPIRDYLCPRDPTSSPLLCITKERYFNRLSVDVAPEKPGFGEARWIKSEDVNVEHLLNVFASLDGNSDDVWYTCSKFIRHLYWHKRRGTVLGSAIEGLPDDHRFKRDCLFELSRLPGVIGNHSEQKRLLSSLLVLERGRGDDKWVAHILVTLSRANWKLGLRTEGMQQLKEALKTYKRLGNTVDQANCLLYLTRLLENDKQLDAAEQAASQAIELLPKRGQEFRVCQSHRFLGNIYRSKGEREKAIHHFEVALGIASPLNWHSEIYWIHDSLARLLSDEGKFDDASNHIEQAKSHAVDDAYDLGYAMKQQAKIWYRQSRLEEARSEALRAIEILENLGAAKDVEACETLLRDIEETMEGKVNYINLLYAAQHHVYGFSSHY